jgi:ABC-2 type transport system permease protein
LVALLLGPTFLRSAVRSAGQAAALGSLHRPREDKRFRSGLAPALWRKELQLLARDTGAMSQLFLQMAYTAPISFIIWASAREDAPMAMAISPTLVMIACHLSAALTWLALSSEDAPQLMASAPVSRREIERRKLEAVCGPLLLVILLPIIWLGLYEPRHAAVTAVFSLAAGACTALLNMWNPLPGRRADMMRRHAPSKLVALMEHLFAMFWAIGVVAAIMGKVIWIFAVAAAALLLWFNYRRARKRWAQT